MHLLTLKRNLPKRIMSESSIALPEFIAHNCGTYAPSCKVMKTEHLSHYSLSCLAWRESEFQMFICASNHATLNVASPSIHWEKERDGSDQSQASFWLDKTFTQNSWLPLKRSFCKGFIGQIAQQFQLVAHRILTKLVRVCTAGLVAVGVPGIPQASVPYLPLPFTSTQTHRTKLSD